MSPSLILSFIAGYFVLLFVISWITSRKADNRSFFIGNKQSPWYLVAFGMIGASLSGVTFISIPGVIGNLDSVNGQFSYMQVVFGYLVGYTVIALVLMPLYYRLNLTSIYTYLEQRFGFWSYKIGAFYFLLSRTVGASFRLFLVAIVLQKFVFDPWNVPFPVTVLFTLFLIWIYTFKGGIKTIVWTDTLQTTFMLVAVCVSVYLIAVELNTGLFGLVETIQESQYSQLFFWDPKQDNYFFKQFLSGAFIAIVMTGLDQDMMQKNNSCKNIREAQMNMFSFSVVLVFVNFLFVGLGALLYIYAESKGIAIPSEVCETCESGFKTRTDYLFPELALHHFSPLAGITFILGLIAAAYSSADSALTALTTSFCVDFLNFEKRDEEAKEKLNRTRIGVHIGFTLVLFVVIILFKYGLKDDVVTDLFKAAGYTYGPLLGLFFFGILTKRKIKDVYAIPICLAAPVLTYLVNKYSEQLLWGYKFGFEILILNGALTFLGLLAISKRN